MTDLSLLWPVLNEDQLFFLKSFFKYCPDTLIKSMLLKSYSKNYTLMTTDDSCSLVYILLSGRLQAIEERTLEGGYHFAEIEAIEIIGDFELFSKESGRMLTLTTKETSLCLIISAASYLEWIRGDASALFIRIQMLIRQLATENKTERQLLFLDNRARLVHYLLEEYNRRDHKAGGCVITDTRIDLASKLGFSIRTANRTIKELAEEGAVKMKHGKMVIDQESYEKLLSKRPIQ